MYIDPKDIRVGDKSLAEIIASHEKWLRDEVGGARAHLVRANLESANLYSANLERANLESAHLESANLYSANLESANLYSANLESANLESAHLESANLYGANLVRANQIFLLGPIGSRGDFLYAVKHDKKIMVKTGCFWGALAAFENAVKSTHEDNIHSQTYNAAIVLIRKYFKLVE
jgi:hypothetical protein